MILEKLLAAIEANTAALNASRSGAATAAVTPVSQAGALAAASTVPANVTPEQLTALITPHVSNPAIKDELGVVMRGMGINAFPETQPHQVAPLYALFQAVIAKHTGGGNVNTPNPAATSII